MKGEMSGTCVVLACRTSNLIHARQRPLLWHQEERTPPAAKETTKAAPEASPPRYVKILPDQNYQQTGMYERKLHLSG